jgi:hypothetical protein
MNTSKLVAICIVYLCIAAMPAIAQENNTTEVAMTISDNAKNYIAQHFGTAVDDQHCFASSGISYTDPKGISQTGSTQDVVATLKLGVGSSARGPGGEVYTDITDYTTVDNDAIVWIGNHLSGDDRYCTAVIPEDLTPETGYIDIKSYPSGASIYLGDEDDYDYKGTTPKTIGVSPGSYYDIKLTKSGYDDYTTRVYVSAGETEVIDEDLTSETGYIDIKSYPSGASIYLDGTYKGTSPTTISDASPGSHTLKLEKYGYAEWLTSVPVTAGVTESITAHLTTVDVSPPAIRIDKPIIIEYNDNELLEEGEKVEITYGANDSSGVTSIKIMLDGITLESQNQAGTYTVTTNSLTTGKHVIRVEATDSKSNMGFEELQITVERTGPSVYFGTTRTTINKGEDAIFTLSAVNPIGNPQMTVQLILKPPSGVSVTSSSFAKAGSGLYTCTQTIESGDNVRSIEVRLTGNEVGTYEIESEVYYQFDGSPKSPTRYETLTLIVEPDTHPIDSESEAREIMVPGFGAMVALAGLLAVHLWRKRR